MALELNDSACTLNIVEGGVQCTSFPFVNSLVPPVASSTTQTHVAPSTGPAGRTRFTIIYRNLAQSYDISAGVGLPNARYLDLINTTNTIFSSFASGLGHARDTSLASNAIDVKINLDFKSISESYQATILFGGAPSTDSEYYQGDCWRLRITKTHTPGVLVMEVPSTAETNNAIWPQGFSTWNYNKITQQIEFLNLFNPNFSTPATWFPVSGQFNNVQFYLAYSGSVTPTNTILFVNGLNVSAPQILPTPSGAPFYTVRSVAPSLSWVGGVTNAEIGTNILGQAGPTSFYIPQANLQQQTQLLDCSGVALPSNSTPFVGFTSYSSPIIIGSQWRFMRVLPDWLSGIPAVNAYRNNIDAGLPSTVSDITITVNTDLNRLLLAPPILDFSDSFLTAQTNQISYKAIIIHELFHGLGFISGIYSTNMGQTASALYNHYAFVNANRPLTQVAFSDLSSNPRNLTGAINWISNGTTINAPIGPSNTSHLLGNNNLNGIMEPFISQGNVIPTGTEPNGGPSAFDYGVLQCCCILTLADTICVAEDTLVTTRFGPLKIKDIKSGDLVQDCSGEWIPVEACLEIPSNIDFIVIPCGVLGENQPSSDLYIRSGHPLLIDGREVDCADLLGLIRPGCAGSVRKESNLKGKVRVYTLVTEKRSFVQMQNCFVGTWSRSAWENYRQNDCNSTFSTFYH